MKASKNVVVGLNLGPILRAMYPECRHNIATLEYYVQAWSLAWTGLGIDFPIEPAELEHIKKVLTFYAGLRPEFIQALFYYELHVGIGYPITVEKCRDFYKAYGVDTLDASLQARLEQWLYDKDPGFTEALAERQKLDRVLNRLYTVEDPDDALDLLAEETDTWYSASLFSQCDDFLRAIDLSRLQENVLVGLLMFTHVAAESLPYRPTLIQEVRKALGRLMPTERIDKIYQEIGVAV